MTLLEWHLPEVMMNYLESDERFASSELKPICSHELASVEISPYSASLHTGYACSEKTTSQTALLTPQPRGV